MSNKMLSVKLFGAGDIRIVEEDIPSMSDRQMLVRIRAAAVCGTDIRSWRFGRPGVDEDHPLTLGHEVCAEIAEIGTSVQGLKKGMRVAVVPCTGCGTCAICTSGNPHQCRELKACGMNTTGLMSEYALITEAMISQGNVIPLSDKLSDCEAAVVEPLSCVYYGFSMLDAKPGERALVIGAGPIGTMHSMLLHDAGLRVAVSEKDADRRRMAEKNLPFAEVFDGSDIKGFTDSFTEGCGFDVAVTACPDPEAQMVVFSLMGFNGRVHFFGGVPKELQPVPLDTNEIHYKALRVVGSSCSSVYHYRRALAIAESGGVDLSKIVTSEIDKKDAIRAFEMARDLKGLKNVIVF